MKQDDVMPREDYPQAIPRLTQAPAEGAARLSRKQARSLSTQQDMRSRGAVRSSAAS